METRPYAAGSGLTWAQGVVPTPHGPLRTTWRISGSRRAPAGFRLDVRAPHGTTGTVYIPLYGAQRRVTIDGKPADGATRAGDHLRIEGVSGSHTLRWGTGA